MWCPCVEKSGNLQINRSNAFKRIKELIHLFNIDIE